MKALKKRGKGGEERSRWEGEKEWDEVKAIVERKESGNCCRVGALLEHACI